MPPAPVRIALVGCGRMGRVHLRLAREHPAVELVGVCDPALSPDSVGVPILSFEQVVTSPSIDGVLIAAPTAVHEDLVRAALEGGKDVLCEKPLTLRVDADHALHAAAIARGCVLQVGFWRRFAEPYRRMRDLIAAGTIGRVTGVRTAQWDAHPPAPAFCDPRISGGLEIDCGVHEFDLVRWLVGTELLAVTSCAPPAARGLAAVGDVDTVFGLAVWQGHCMTIDLTRTAGDRDSIRTEVIGECGSIVTEFVDAGTLIVRCGDSRTVVELATRDVIADALRLQLAAFAKAVRSRRLQPDAATPLDSAFALGAAQAMRAARDARWVQVRA